MLSNDNQYSDNDDVPYWEFIYGHGDIKQCIFHDNLPNMLLQTENDAK